MSQRANKNLKMSIEKLNTPGVDLEKSNIYELGSNWNILFWTSWTGYALMAEKKLRCTKKSKENE